MAWPYIFTSKSREWHLGIKDHLKCSGSNKARTSLRKTVRYMDIIFKDSSTIRIAKKVQLNFAFSNSNQLQNGGRQFSCLEKMGLATHRRKILLRCFESSQASTVSKKAWNWHTIKENRLSFKEPCQSLAALHRSLN